MNVSVSIVKDECQSSILLFYGIKPLDIPTRDTTVFETCFFAAGPHADDSRVSLPSEELFRLNFRHPTLLGFCISIIEHQKEGIFIFRTFFIILFYFPLISRIIFLISVIKPEISHFSSSSDHFLSWIFCNKTTSL